jgi:hypothetical protein
MNAVVGLVGMEMMSVNILVTAVATALVLGVVALHEFKRG